MPEPTREEFARALADELYALIEPFKGQAKTPETTGDVTAIIQDLLARRTRGTVEVSGKQSPDGGLDFTVTTSDRGLIEQWANAGMVDDPAAIGMMRVGDAWMWPPVVVEGADDVG